PTAIATPTITILIPIIHMATTTIPMAATGTGVMGTLREREAAAVSTATAAVAVALGTAVAAGTGDIIDLVLASSGSSPAPRPPGFIWPMKPGADAAKAVANFGLNPGLNVRLLQLGQGLKQFWAKEEKHEKENGLPPEVVRAPFGGRAHGAQPGAGAGETRGQLLRVAAKAAKGVEPDA